MYQQTATAEPLNAVQSSALAALVDQPTRYEVVVTRTRDGMKALLGYTHRRTSAGLLALLHGGGNGVPTMCFLRCADTTRIMRDEPARVLIGDAGVIAFTGRTERDVIMTRTPLPRCEDAG